jgi:hypothetical protein
MLTKMFVFVNIFAKIKNFSVNVNEKFHFRKHFRERYMSRLSCCLVPVVRS